MLAEKVNQEEFDQEVALDQRSELKRTLGAFLIFTLLLFGLVLYRFVFDLG